MAEGRRERMKLKIRERGIAGLAPHEILEFLLYPYVPRKDTSPIARELLKHFGSLENVLFADEQALLSVKGMPKLAAITFPTYHDILSYAQETALLDNKTLITPTEAGEYVSLKIGKCVSERMLIVFLNGRGRVLATKVIYLGNSLETTLKVREITTQALNVKAEAVIIGHNHPHGGTNASVADKNSTKELIKILKPLSIKLIDHIIAAGDEYSSMRGMIDSYYKD